MLSVLTSLHLISSLVFFSFFFLFVAFRVLPLHALTAHHLSSLMFLFVELQEPAASGESVDEGASDCRTVPGARCNCQMILVADQTFFSGPYGQGNVALTAQYMVNTLGSVNTIYRATQFGEETGIGVALQDVQVRVCVCVCVCVCVGIISIDLSWGFSLRAPRFTSFLLPSVLTVCTAERTNVPPRTARFRTVGGVIITLLE
jgi:hypothetical protein